MHSSPLRLLALIVALVVAAACTRDTVPVEPVAERVGHPGFDIANYPGDAAMRAWRGASPYEWVGYYLPAPCHRDTTWVGTRIRLDAMGWGLAAIYVGQQAWDAMDVAQLDGGLVELGAPSCTTALLTAAEGAAEASDAVAKMASEGFPTGSVIFLDLEHVDSVPQALRDYYSAWLSRVLADGRYRPGVYVHRANAPTIRGDVIAAFEAAARSDVPAFWIAGGTGFGLRKDPADVGLPYASVWQGLYDDPETWGGVLLTVDGDVASSASPSAPR